MLSGFSFTLILVILLALSYDFITGFHDTANSIATSVSTRVLSPRWAIIMAATLNCAGALFSDNVAKTVSKGIVSTENLPSILHSGNQVVQALPQFVIIAALLSAISWGLITWYFGIPSSSSHALIGGLVGATVTYAVSFKSVIWSGVLDKVVIPLLTSPILGFVLGFMLMSLLFKILAKVSIKIINRWFAKLQLVSAALMSFAHGNNDAQKSMGIITLALVSAGIITADYGIPWEVKIACALMMGLGTSVGGWRIIKTMGVNMIKLQPIGGFAAETTAATIILGAASLGMQVSTTHVISASIMGVGAAKRFSSVRWSLAKDIVITWFLTIPVTALLGAGITLVIKLFIPS
jgi:inorganic phosphate transporter, PiT family